jgi:hypothetical protein
LPYREQSRGPISTYVARANDAIISIFLFTLSARSVQVLNEMIALERAEVERFASHIFNRFSGVDIILFNAVAAGFTRLALPFQRHRMSEDIVLTMPPTAQEYLASLGKSTRKTIKGYSNRLRRAFPSFRYQVFEGGQVDVRHILDIIAFKRQRLAARNKASGIDQEETQRLIALVRRYGLVGVATIDGRICAGAISCRVGGHYFMLLSAHDPQYDSYRLGMLCCYFAVCDCIARGGSECHFLRGRYGYKTMLLGQRRDFHRLLIYRSHVHMLRNPGIVLKTACAAALRQAGIWLRHNPSLARMAKACIVALRHLRVAGQARLRAAWRVPIRHS